MKKHHKKPCKAATFFIVSVPRLVIEMSFLLKSCAFQPLCTNESNPCIDFGAVILDLHCQKGEKKPASCPVILIHLSHTGATF